ncbi:MAG: hypothetical protein N2745_04550 [Syntrophorhabdaceae bacterium]|nr:hypothetical protein [Syntrophorhabdaceae bacterium]
MRHIHLEGDGKLEKSFFLMLQGGFYVECPIGTSIKEFLVDSIGIDETYLAEKISTIFLDGKCVDDIGKAVIEEGSTLALSSAMPGLAGAILKRGGPLKVMRDGISYGKEEKFLQKRKGICSIKLFNLLTEDLGPLFLKSGIYIKARDLSGLISTKSCQFLPRDATITVDGKSVDFEVLLDILKEEEDELLFFTFDVKWER